MSTPPHTYLPISHHHTLHQHQYNFSLFLKSAILFITQFCTCYSFCLKCSSLPFLPDAHLLIFLSNCSAAAACVTPSLNFPDMHSILQDSIAFCGCFLQSTHPPVLQPMHILIISYLPTCLPLLLDCELEGKNESGSVCRPQVYSNTQNTVTHCNWLFQSGRWARGGAVGSRRKGVNRWHPSFAPQRSTFLLSGSTLHLSSSILGTY